MPPTYVQMHKNSAEVKSLVAELEILKKGSESVQWSDIEKRLSKMLPVQLAAVASEFHHIGGSRDKKALLKTISRATQDESPAEQRSTGKITFFRSKR